MQASLRIAFLSAFTVAACGSSGSSSGGSDPSSSGNLPPVPTGTTTAPPPGQPAPALTVSLDRPVVTVRRSGKVSVNVTIAKTAFDASVDVALTGLPSGVTSPAATIAKGQTTAAIEFDATADATLGKATVTIAAKSSTVAAATSLSLVVADGQALDPTFGTGGMLSYLPDDAYRWPSALALQTDAKILVAGGYAPNTAGAVHTGYVYRFTDTGAIDTTFGAAGLALVTGLASVSQIKLQTDGNMVVCGGAQTNNRLLVSRLSASGVIDTTFGSGGLAQIAADGPIACESLVIDDSGRILVTGEQEITSNTENALVARFTSAGVLDTTFGTGGTTTTVLGGSTAQLGGLHLTSAGMFAHGQWQALGSNESDGIVAKLDLDGHVDTTFGAAGLYNEEYGVFDVLPLPSGNILCSNAIQMFRLTSAGALDTTFGVSNQLETNSDDWKFSLNANIIDAAGEIYRFRSQGDNWLPELWAYTPNGMIDTTFAKSGRITLEPGEATDPVDIAIGSDGRLVVLAGEGSLIWLARFVL